jgi:hypothetical protein
MLLDEKGFCKVRFVLKVCSDMEKGVYKDKSPEGSESHGSTK